MAPSLADRQGAAYRKYIREKKGRNKPPKDEPWIWMTHPLMESPAWRSLSPNGRKVMDRVLIEHMSHGGSENGNLIVTHSDFAGYGVTRRLITQAINEVEFLGLAIPKRGGRWHGTNHATKFRITWMCDRTGAPATNEWKGRTLEQIASWRAEVKRQNETGKAWRQKSMRGVLVISKDGGP